MRKIFVMMVALVGLSMGVRAQVANDGCAGAFNLGTLGTPAPCNGLSGQGIGAPSTFNLTNVNAQPENPYTFLTGCQPVNGSMPNPAADVWYVVTVTGNALSVNITGLGTPSVAIYTGACGSLTGRGCAVGNAGSLSAVFEQMLPGSQVYIQVSGGSTVDTGPFSMTLRNNNSCDDCMLQSALTVSPQPINGTYQNGTTVTFCFSVTDWYQRNTNWIHGVVPTFGAGWNTSTLTSQIPAASCDGLGSWGWYNSITSSATGNTFGPGFFYETGNPVPINGNPGDNYGDNCGQSGTSVNPNPNWVFCWTITTSDCPPGSTGTDLSVRINTLGDGESGAWTNFACSNDPDYLFSAQLTCCDPPTTTTEPVTCNGNSDGSAIAVAGGTGPYAFTWTALGSGTVLQSNPNVTTGQDTLSSLPAGTYVVAVFDSFDFCLTRDTFTINQPAPLSLSFTAQNLDCFNDSSGSVTANVSGGNGNYHYQWNTGDTVPGLTGLGAGTYVVVVTDTAYTSGGGGGGNVTLYEEDFDAPVSAWNLNVPTGPNGADNNFWQIDDDEGGVPPTGCGVANNGDSTLHITSVFCPTCGAAYDAGGLCGLLFCPETNMRAESPSFSTVGFSNVTLEFDFISLGDGLIDNAKVVFNAGLGWTVLNPSIKTVNCLGGQGQWTAFSAALPASCWNNPNVQVGFNWTNNDDGVGADPSVAINNLRVLAPQPGGGGPGFVLCTITDSVTLTQPTALQVSTTGYDLSCSGVNDGSATVTYSGGTPGYSVSWSNSQTLDSISGLAGGTYIVTVTDNNGCQDTSSVTLAQPLPVSTNMVAVQPLCAGDSAGCAIVLAGGGAGGFAYVWSTGDTNDTICGLPAGMYYVTVTDTTGGGGSGSNVIAYEEDFDAPVSPWTLNVPTGPNGADNNFWQIDDDEGGVLPPGCGVANNGDSTLHITSVFCPTCGAAYDAGGLCGLLFCPETNMRAESPIFSTAGLSNVTLTFDFISLGDLLLDNASVVYNDGLGWQVLNPSIKTLNCVGGQGQWTAFNAVLPASCWNNPTVQVGFNWTNNDDGVGSDPSVAINNLQVIGTTPGGGGGQFCDAVDSILLVDPAALVLLADSIPAACSTPTGSAIVIASGGTGAYSYTWNTTPVQANDTASGLLPGSYQVIVSDANGCEDSISISVPNQPGPTISLDNVVDATCSNSANGSATVSSTGGTAPVSFAWNTTPVQGTATATNLAAGSYMAYAIDVNGCTDSVAVTVNAPPALLAVVNTQTATCNQSNGYAFVVASGGTPGYSYAWNTSPVQTTDTAFGLSSSSYTVTVTDANGCTVTGTGAVGNLPGPSPIITNRVDVTCNGGNNGSATVSSASGTLPLTFAWSNGQTTSTASNLTAGTYTVTVTDASGCVDSTSVTITQPSPIVGNMTVTNVTCNAVTGDGTAYIQASGGTGPLSFLWSNGQTTNYIQNLPAGPVDVTITDNNGCAIVVSGLINRDPSPVVDAFGTGVFCEGSGGAQIFASGTGGTGPYYYEWWCDSTNTYCGLDSVFDNDPIANPTVSTWYYVQVTDFNGCRSNIDSVFVTVLPKPVVDAGPDIYICGDSAPCVILNPLITGAAGPYQYQWTPSLGLSNDTIPNPCARPDTTTIYTLQVVAANGCASFYNTVDTNSTVIVNVNPIPVAEAGPDRHLCLGDSVELQGYGFGAGPVYDYEWSPSNGLSSITIPNPMASPGFTTDYVLVVWSNGCPSYGDTVTVNVHTIPTVDAGPDVEICLGENALLDAQAWGDSTSPTYNFQWVDNFGVIGSSAVEDLITSPDTTHTYSVTATSIWGCESAPDFATVYVKPTPLAEAGPQLVICLGDTVTLQGGYFYTTTASVQDTTQIWYSWTPGNTLSDTTIRNPQAWPGSSQFYYLTVQYNTCITYGSVLVTVFPDIGGTAMADTSVICRFDSVQLTSAGGIGGATFTWFPSAGLSDPNIANPVAFPDSSTTYTLVIREGSCADTLEVQIAVLPTPVPDYIHSPESGCAPHTVSFVNTSADAIFYTWNFYDGTPVVNTQNPTHIFTAPGDYPVTLTAYAIGGCSAVAQNVTVHVADTAYAEFASDPDFPVVMYLPNTHVQFINLSQNANTWWWDFGDGDQAIDFSPHHQYTQPGEYMVTLRAITPEGCESEVTHGPYVVMAPDLFIPNVFTPNADGVNDRWLVQYTGSQPVNITVFDRWGGLIYTSTNKMEGWDGNNQKGERAPEGVYYYHVKAGDRDFAGEVTLMR